VAWGSGGGRCEVTPHDGSKGGVGAVQPQRQGQRPIGSGPAATGVRACGRRRPTRDRGLNGAVNRWVQSTVLGFNLNQNKFKFVQIPLDPNRTFLVSNNLK
jgi:hypothetical protein